jgi:phage shock protein A
VITVRGGQAPGQGHRTGDTMTHDKIRDAARERMAQTGEPYASARRAVVTEHQGTGGRVGYALRMSGEIRDWLADLRDRDPSTARTVGQALAALLNFGPRLGEPLVAAAADSWAPALAEGLDRSYREKVARLTDVRRSAVDAVLLVDDVRQQAADLAAAREKLQGRRRHLLDAGRTKEAEQVAAALAAMQQQADQVQSLLQKATESSRRLEEESRRLQISTDFFRARKEVLKARYTSAHLGLLIQQGASGPDDTGDRDEPVSSEEAGLLHDAITEMERALDLATWPEGLMELHPAGPDDNRIRILFAVEPPGTALLIAVLDGPKAVRDQYLEAILLSADMLRQVRAGEAPEAAAYGYDSTRSFLWEFYPRDPGAPGTESATPTLD